MSPVRCQCVASLACLAAACASPSPTTSTLDEPLTAAPSHQPSAAVMASVEPPPDPPRTRPPLQQREAAIAAVLGDVCALGYDTSGDRVLVGCTGCSVGEPSDAAAWEIASPLGWAAYLMLEGAFSAPGTDERFIALFGSCNPKHQAYAFLQRREGRWAVLSLQEAHDQDDCQVLRRNGRPDVVICSVARDYIGGDALDMLEAITPAGTQTLLTLLHWRTTTMRQPGTQKIFDFRVESFAMRDVDDDGELDVDVALRERAIPASRWSDGEPLPFEEAAPGELSRVVINSRNGRLVIDEPRSNQLLRRARSLLPRSGGDP